MEAHLWHDWYDIGTRQISESTPNIGWNHVILHVHLSHLSIFCSVDVFCTEKGSFRSASRHRHLTVFKRRRFIVLSSKKIQNNAILSLHRPTNIHNKCTMVKDLSLVLRVLRLELDEAFYRMCIENVENHHLHHVSDKVVLHVCRERFQSTSLEEYVSNR